MNEASDVASLQEAYEHGGWLAVSSVAVMLVIKAWRSPSFQSALEKSAPKLAWSTWPVWLRISIVVLTSVASSVLGGLAGGVSIGAALVGALPIALGAIGAHELLVTVTRPAAPLSPEESALREATSLKPPMAPVPRPGEKP